MLVDALDRRHNTRRRKPRRVWRQRPSPATLWLRVITGHLATIGALANPLEPDLPGLLIVGEIVTQRERVLDLLAAHRHSLPAPLAFPQSRDGFLFTLRLEALSIESALCTADAQTLFASDQEGVYLRREWSDAAGEIHRFMAFVEKDRPGSACMKPEQWIYDARPGHPPLTIPIPPLVMPAHRKQAEKRHLL